MLTFMKENYDSNIDDILNSVNKMLNGEEDVEEKEESDEKDNKEENEEK